MRKYFHIKIKIVKITFFPLFFLSFAAHPISPTIKSLCVMSMLLRVSVFRQ
uniref:Uncharacterized protein n=1 Tax=Octopus bimaculoides TaxID=37653 RepID=A0A0L8GBI3_OCTBM